MTKKQRDRRVQRLANAARHMAELSGIAWTTIGEIDGLLTVLTLVRGNLLFIHALPPAMLRDLVKHGRDVLRLMRAHARQRQVELERMKRGFDRKAERLSVMLVGRRAG